MPIIPPSDPLKIKLPEVTTDEIESYNIPIKSTLYSEEFLYYFDKMAYYDQLGVKTPQKLEDIQKMFIDNDIKLNKDSMIPFLDTLKEQYQNKKEYQHFISSLSYLYDPEVVYDGVEYLLFD